MQTVRFRYKKKEMKTDYENRMQIRVSLWYWLNYCFGRRRKKNVSFHRDIIECYMVCLLFDTY